MTKKLNCWEFKNCGRGPGGCKAKRLGICLTAVPDDEGIPIDEISLDDKEFGKYGSGIVA